MQKAQQIHQYYNHWRCTKRILSMNICLGTKYHSVCHEVEYTSISNITIGFISEARVKPFHKDVL